MILLSGSNMLFSLIACLTGIVSAQQSESHSSDHKAPMPVNIIGVLVLIFVSAIVAGLTLSMLSMDLTTLSVLEIAGTAEEKESASRIAPLRKKGHLLLTSLLLTNTVLNESLPILFDEIFSQGVVSIAVSTVIIVLMAEIVPQAVFTKYRLQVGRIFALPMRFLILAWAPVSWPISKILDKLCGTAHGLIYSVNELSALIQLHTNHHVLNPETSRLAQNTLSLQGMHMKDIMKVAEVPLLSLGARLSRTEWMYFKEKNFARVFISKEDNLMNIVGVLDLKVLELLDKEAFDMPVVDLPLVPCYYMPFETTVAKAACELLQPGCREGVVLVTAKKRGDEIPPPEEGTLSAKLDFFYGSSSEISLFNSTRSTLVDKAADNCVVYDIPLSPAGTRDEIVGFFDLTDILDVMAQPAMYEQAVSNKEKETKTSAFQLLANKLLFR